MAKIEVEYIGSLSEEKFEELKDLFSKSGEIIKEKKRLTLMYFRDKIPKDLTEIKDEKVDLRFRVTNKEPEVVLKYGDFSGNHARKEISLDLSGDDSEKYVEFLSLLGWNLCVIYATDTSVFTYKGIEFSLVKIEDYGYNFEAEILTEESDVENAKDKIEKVLSELELRPFCEQELNKQCNEINNKLELKIDLSKNKFSEIKERFSEYFL